MTDIDVSPDLPRLPRLPRAARGIARIQPPSLGRSRLGLPVLTEGEEPARAYPEPPGDFDGSPEEWAIYWAATILKGEPGIDWFFKTPVFGDVSILGFSPDFYFTEERVAIDVVNIDAPDEQQAGTRLAAMIRRAILTRFQATYIVIESDDAEQAPRDVLENALIGVDLSRWAS